MPELLTPTIRPEQVLFGSGISATTPSGGPPPGTPPVVPPPPQPAAPPSLVQPQQAVAAPGVMPPGAPTLTAQGGLSPQQSAVVQLALDDPQILASILGTVQSAIRQPTANSAVQALGGI